jgi:hypothetical protein
MFLLLILPIDFPVDTTRTPASVWRRLCPWTLGADGGKADDGQYVYTVQDASSR